MHAPHPMENPEPQNQEIPSCLSLPKTSKSPMAAAQDPQTAPEVAR